MIKVDSIQSIRLIATFRSHFLQLQVVMIMIMINSFEKHNNCNYNYKGHRLLVDAKPRRQLADHVPLVIMSPNHE